MLRKAACATQQIADPQKQEGATWKENAKIAYRSGSMIIFLIWLFFI